MMDKCPRNMQITDDHLFFIHLSKKLLLVILLFTPALRHFLEVFLLLLRSPSEVLFFCILMRCRWRPESLTHSDVSPSSLLIFKNPTSTPKRAIIVTHICVTLVLTSFRCCWLAFLHTHTKQSRV